MTLQKTGFKWLWLSILVILFDQLTKQLVLRSILPYDIHSLTSFFNLTFATNKGAAFSFLNQAGHWGFWFLSLFSLLVTLILLIWLYRTPYEKILLNVGLTLVIGGALGNLIDRTFYGYVIDFLDVHLGSLHWPAFNIADSAIVVGTFLLIVDLFKKE